MQIVKSGVITGIALSALTLTPLVFAQAKAAAIHDDPGTVVEGKRPPQGYARPPFHIRHNFTNTTPSGIRPDQVRHVYGFDLVANQGAGQTIAIVDAFDHPNIESDLAVFNLAFGLPSCTTANGCFKKIFASGNKPRANSGWALEISLDVEWAHAIAPAARILLVEAKSNSFTDLMNAVDAAVRNGASVVSMSFGGNEFSGQTTYDSHFNVGGVTFVASSGDSGNGAEYPAASQYVIGVGGTTLRVDASGNYLNESAWSGSGGGISAYEPELSGQTSWPIPYYTGKRGIPDVAYNGDPNTGFAVYDSVSYSGQSGWFQLGGTSAGAPQWAGLFAIANSMRAALIPKKATLTATYNTLYNFKSSAYVANYHDVMTGNNGTCGTVCAAVADYDYVTGLGSCQANNIIPNLVNAIP